jgi:serine/threonine protein kinase
MEEIWYFTKEMVRFFANMQKMRLLHRDIKPGNIMIKLEGAAKRYKVIDFGYAIK